MTITLELPDSLERRLKEKAVLQGISLDRYILQNLEDINQPGSGGPYSEEELLKKINLDLGIEQQVWEQYHNLAEKLHAESISDAERQTFIQLNEAIESANVERVRYLLELSKLRGVSLETVMSDLGIVPALN